MRFCWTLCNAAMLLLAFLSACVSARGAETSPRVTLPLDHPAALHRAALLGRLADTDQISLALTLPLRNPDQLADFLARLSNRSDPDYGHYLTPAQFAAKYSPTQAQYDQVAAFAESEGLTVTGTHPDRLLLDVSGTRGVVEHAFGVQLNWYQDVNGHIFHSADRAPSIPVSLISVLSGVIGLSNAVVRRPIDLVRRDPNFIDQQAGPGTGPDGGFAPSDIRTAYDLTGATETGAGQTLALFELDGYAASDITSYETEFKLPDVKLVNDLIDGATGTAGDATAEVCLDIEMQIALAPSATEIKVYETTQSDSAVLDGYGDIADDNIATEISTSWGLDEPDSGASFIQSEAPIFQQMAAQGQTMFAAAGDNGAYDTGSISDGLTVDDPGSQPYVCSVGGTSLTTASPGGAWKSETTWNGGSPEDGAGGGGISSIWPIPLWQQSAITTASQASSTMRNVPDVSLNADPNVGYAVFVSGGWTVVGGTSASSPLWAGFTALVNQQRLVDKMPVLGQASPQLYPILATSDYDTVFHDIADGSTNLFYPAVTGYDDATGLGTYVGTSLLDVLSSASGPGGIPVAPANVTATPGNDDVQLTWEKSEGATSYDVYRSLSSEGSFVKAGSTTTLTFTVTGLTNGTTYYFVVTAVNANGTSADSKVISAIPAIPIIATYQPGLNFISLPYGYTGASLSAIFGYSDPILALWDPLDSKYALTPQAPLTTIDLGLGYWVRFPQTVVVTLPGTPASVVSNYSISLYTGWNQIGDPFPASVSLSSIIVVSGGYTYSYEDAINSGLIWDLVYQYSPSSQAYEAVGTGGSLQSGSGYFVGAFADVALSIPPP
jgi:kumamolisin